jgi:hypothetical protein
MRAEARFPAKPEKTMEFAGFRPQKNFYCAGETPAFPCLQSCFFHLYIFSILRLARICIFPTHHATFMSRTRNAAIRLLRLLFSVSLAQK